MDGNIGEIPAKNGQKKLHPQAFHLPQFIGHRGMGSGKEKNENTARSLNSCFKFSPMAEIDVQLSLDEEVFVFHDLEIEGLPVEKIHSNDLLNNRIEKFSVLLDSTEIGLNVEVKYNEQTIPVERWCDRILQIVKTHSRNRRIVYSSFNREVCEYINSQLEPVLFLTEVLNKEGIDYSARNKYKGIVTEAEEVLNKPEEVEEAKRKGLYLVTYGRNNSKVEEVNRQIEIGVDSIITDEIERVSKAGREKSR